MTLFDPNEETATSWDYSDENGWEMVIVPVEDEEI